VLVLLLSCVVVLIFLCCTGVCLRFEAIVRGIPLYWDWFTRRLQGLVLERKRVFCLVNSLVSFQVGGLFSIIARYSTFSCFHFFSVEWYCFVVLVFSFCKRVGAPLKCSFLFILFLAVQKKIKNNTIYQIQENDIY